MKQDRQSEMIVCPFFCLGGSAHGFITDNLDESEFITKRDTSIQILGAKVYNDNGDNCILIFGKMVQ